MYLEQDESMPAFIRDVKAYSAKQFEYHSQHSAEIRSLRAQNEYLLRKVNNLEQQMQSFISNHMD